MSVFEGKFIGNKRGFGFVEVEELGEDIFIPIHSKNGAMNNDTVSVKVQKGQQGKRKEGQILKVLKRNTNELVGLFQKSKNFAFVIPDDEKYNDIFISKSNWKKAKNNQKVVVKITKYPNSKSKAEGQIVEILGNVNSAKADMLSLIREFNLPNEFPTKVIKEAKECTKEKISIEGRLDLRSKEMFTIDGEDAKDLDDAVFVDKDEDGIYILGVNIADVSHYVKDGSELNREAIVRGTSVYMLNSVIPMLPTELSNGICSLNQKEDRYALSAIMKINQKGEVIDSEIKKSVIRVTKRMNYHQVAAIIDRNNLLKAFDKREDLTNSKKEKTKEDNKKQEKSVSEFTTKSYVQNAINENKEYIEHFDRMKELAIILKERRKKNGYISLDIPETYITYNGKGEPIDIKPYETNFANEIIEQFMLTANETVAETFFFLEAPFIYRVHEKPEEEKIVDLNKYLFNFGYRIKGKKDDVKPKAFAQILDDIKGKEEEKVISNLLLRTLKIAKYEAENKGHFGIASNYYCHFTSPIRRYPDLFIHKIISKYIEKDYNVSQSFIEKAQAKAIKYAETSSDCEQNATKAERESEKIKKAEYMENKVGEEYEGIISSITSFGMYVELPNTIEGLIKFENMYEDYFIYNEINKTLVGKETNKVYKLGDKVKVKVIEASKITRKINFELLNCD